MDADVWSRQGAPIVQGAPVVVVAEPETAGFDAVVSPTVPVVAPKIADCEPDAEYNRINMLVLRNTMMLNVVDGCSIALPMHRAGAAPTSLMISGPAMTDHRVMAIAAAAETALTA